MDINIIEIGKAFIIAIPLMNIMFQLYDISKSLKERNRLEEDKIAFLMKKERDKKEKIIDRPEWLSDTK